MFVFHLTFEIKWRFNAGRSEFLTFSVKGEATHLYSSQCEPAFIQTDGTIMI